MPLFWPSPSSWLATSLPPRLSKPLPLPPLPAFIPFLPLPSPAPVSYLLYIVSPFVPQILFSNIEDILDLHKEVLSAIESSLQPEPHPQQALGHVFLQFVSAHTKISKYINIKLFMDELESHMQREPCVENPS